MEIIKILWNQRKVSPPKLGRIIGDSMPGLVTSKKSIEEGGTSSILSGYVSKLLQGLIPWSGYIFSLYFSFFPVFFKWRIF